MTVSVIICGRGMNINGDAETNLDILKNIGQSIDILDLNKDDDISAKVSLFTKNTDMIVDALFGTGLDRPLDEKYVELIDCINAQKKPILAVDIPSGLDCDTGKPLGTAVKASYTVTFVAVKKGFVEAADSKLYTGEVFVASIGVKPSD